jgi:hypothetical protein
MYHGVDLLDLWRGEITPRKLLAYIDRLPSHSAFAEASAQDDEIAEMYAGAEDDGSVPSPRIIEWTPERAELVKVNDNLRSLTSLVLSALGGKSDPPKPEPRPETALDRMKERLETEAYTELLDLIDKARTREE